MAVGVAGVTQRPALLTLAFCCSVRRLMEMRLLDLESPITTHQPSSRFCGGREGLRGAGGGTIPSLAYRLQVWHAPGGRGEQ